MDYAEKFRPIETKQLLGKAQITYAEGLLNRVRKGDIVRKLLISGPSGSGKTTIARMYVQAIIGDGMDIDSSVLTMNGSAQNRIDDIRSMVLDTLRLGVMPPLEYRIYFINEIQGLTAQAQDALLDPIENENLPAHVIIIGTTTDPQKIKKTLQSRFNKHFKLPGLSRADLQKKAEWIRQAVMRDTGESLTFDPNIIDQIISDSGGNGREFDELIGSLIDGTYVVSDNIGEKDEKSLLYQVFFQSPNLQKWLVTAEQDSDYYRLAIGLSSFAIKAIKNQEGKYNREVQRKAEIILSRLGMGLSPYTSDEVSFCQKLVLIYSDLQKGNK